MNNMMVAYTKEASKEKKTRQHKGCVSTVQKCANKGIKAKGKSEIPFKLEGDIRRPDYSST
jgi:hypothetical protein